MYFLEFGNKDNKAIILIHGFANSWKMWTTQIDVFSKDYFVIVPVLDGHDIESNSTFTTVEKAAADISNYVIQTYGNHIFAICGASLGATIGISILAQSQLKVDKAIIDGGPVVPMNKLALYFAIKLRIDHIHKAKKGSKSFRNKFIRTFGYSEELVDDIMKILANMTKETCRNLHLSVFGYSLPASIAQVKTDIAYWYGSKEAIFGKKYAQAILAKIPNAKIKVFDGFNHGELCMRTPNIYINEATKFLEYNNNPNECEYK